MAQNYLNVKGLAQCITNASERYEVIAPTVKTYLDDLDSRISNPSIYVSAWELAQVFNLRKEGHWLPPVAAIDHCRLTMNALEIEAI